MMKKNGFTLAEVLITLAIIGVVATMTLPTLMTNTGEQQAKTALKKGINILSEAVQMHEQLEGYNYATLDALTAGISIEDAGVGTFKGLLRERTKVDYKKAADGVTLTTTATTLTSPEVIFFADGTAILFNAAATTATTVNQEDENDKMPTGFEVIFDTNGTKGPNKISLCSTTAVTSTSNADDTSVDVEECNTKSHRLIADQFRLKLRGNVVQPVGAAATWVFTN